MTLPVLLTVRQFCHKYPWAKEGTLRAAILKGDTNGFDACIVNLGRKILLDETKVFEWLTARKPKADPPKEETPPETTELLTVKQFTDRYPGISKEQIQGITKACRVKTDKGFLIHEIRAFDWIREQYRKVAFANTKGEPM